MGKAFSSSTQQEETPAPIESSSTTATPLGDAPMQNSSSLGTADVKRRIAMRSVPERVLNAAVADSEHPSANPVQPGHLVASAGKTPENETRPLSACAASQENAAVRLPVSTETSSGFVALKTQDAPKFQPMLSSSSAGTRDFAGPSNSASTRDFANPTSSSGTRDFTPPSSSSVTRSLAGPSSSAGSRNFAGPSSSVDSPMSASDVAMDGVASGTQKTPKKRKRASLQKSKSFDKGKKPGFWNSYRTLQLFCEAPGATFECGTKVSHKAIGAGAVHVYSCVKNRLVLRCAQDGKWMMQKADDYFSADNDDDETPCWGDLSAAIVYNLYHALYEFSVESDVQDVRDTLAAIKCFHFEPPSNLASLANNLLHDWFLHKWESGYARGFLRNQFAACFAERGLIPRVNPAAQLAATMTAEKNDDSDFEDTSFDYEPDEFQHGQQALECLDVNRRENIAFEEYADKVTEAYDIIDRNGMLPDMRFNFMKVLSRVNTHLSRIKNGCHSELDLPRMIGGGKTQSGKSALKMAIAVLGHLWGFATVVVTPGGLNATQLARNFNSKLYNRDEELPYAFTITKALDENGDSLSRSKLLDRIEKTFDSTSDGGGIIVANYTESQLRKIRDRICAVDQQNRRRVILLLDEADDLLKHEKEDASCRKQQIQLYSLIRKINFVVMVTATPLPIFIDILEEKKTKIKAEDIIILEASGDYIATEDFKPLKDANGQDIFLEPGSLNFKNNFTNDQVVTMVHNALGAPGEKRKSLIVDITDGRVNAQGNIYEKAGRIADHFAENEMVLIAVAGRGMKYRKTNEADSDGGYGDWQDFDKTWTNPTTQRTEPFTLSHAITFVEKTLKWDGPIMVLGYSVIFRGISIRSDTRVPTHLIVNLTNGLSTEKVVQAFGRGTGNFRDQLQRNGFNQVTVLGQKEDYALMRNYPALVEDVQKVLAQPGKTFKAAMREAFEKHDVMQSRNIGHTNRNYMFKLLKHMPDLLPIPDSINFAECLRPGLLRYAKQYKVKIPKNVESTVDSLAERLNEERNRRKQLVTEDLSDDGESGSSTSSSSDDDESEESPSKRRRMASSAGEVKPRRLDVQDLTNISDDEK